MVQSKFKTNFDVSSRMTEILDPHIGSNFILDYERHGEKKDEVDYFSLFDHEDNTSSISESYHEDAHKKSVHESIHDEMPSLGEDSTSLRTQSRNCFHPNTRIEKENEICLDCGEIVSPGTTLNTDIKYNADHTRIHFRKLDDKSIFKDVEMMGFNEAVVLKANDMYLNVANNKTYRGSSRKAIIFACIFYSLNTHGDPQSFEKLIKMFGISKKVGSKGIKYVNLFLSKDFDIKTAHMTPITLVREIMTKFQATKEQMNEVEDIFHSVKNRSSMLNRVRPQSMASGLVCYWIKRSKKNIKIKDFMKKIPLSEMTINKIVAEIETVLG